VPLLLLPLLLLQVTLAFINAKRPKECGACGSLLDAVCLQKLSSPAAAN
jgi:hypothetical protein